MQLYVLEVLFKNFNFEYVKCINGFQAYQEIAKSVQEYHEMIQRDPDANVAAEKMLFDLCVFDLTMPICNGFEACKKICSLYSKKKLL